MNDHKSDLTASQAGTPHNDIFVRRSPMSGMMCSRDWSSSSLGDPAQWPMSLRTIVTIMLDSGFPMFLAWGDDLSFVYNDAYVEILGLKHPDALGKPFSEVWSEIWADIVPLVNRALAGEGTWIEDLALVMRRSGHDEDVAFTFSYSPARNDSGDIAGLFCVCTETTRKVQAERSLRQLNHSLENVADSQSRKLGLVEEQLRQSQKMEAIGQLTGGVAHDFNNLLTVIKGSVELLRRDTVTEEKRLRYIEAIGSTADRAAKLTGQLLAFARRQALRPALFNAGDGVAEVAEMVSTLTGGRIELKLNAPEIDCYIRADRSQFDTALINMAINARDAMKGEGRLTITTRTVKEIPSIRTHPPQTGEFVAVSLADTGQGIAEKDLSHIFEPFFTTKGVGEGTGLGLSQVLGFAKQSGGDIGVQSTLGEGSIFTLYLPRAFPHDEETEIDHADPAINGEGYCILVVEDNEQVGSFATEALRELGYDSILAITGQAALAELEKCPGRFHIVFSDVVMPGMNGLELAGEVKRKYSEVSVILTSGYSHVLSQNAEHGYELLHKPYSVEQLSRVLRTAIGRQARKKAATAAEQITS